MSPRRGRRASVGCSPDPRRLSRISCGHPRSASRPGILARTLIHSVTKRAVMVVAVDVRPGGVTVVPVRLWKEVELR